MDMKKLIMIFIVAVTVCSCSEEQYAEKKAHYDAVENTSESEAMPSKDNASKATSDTIPKIRKIIYKANMQLVVDDFKVFEKELSKKVNALSGYVSTYSSNSNSGEWRSGTWQIRIPVKHFQTFMDNMEELGVAEAKNISSQDVSEEFVDLTARLKNKQVLIKRLWKIIENKTGRTEDLLKVERELARVQGEAERIEGRLRYLSQKAEMTTISLSAREEKDYVPPQTPDYATTVSSTWSGSIDNLTDFAKSCFLLIVSATPWLIVLAIFSLPLLIFKKKFKKKVVA